MNGHHNTLRTGHTHDSRLEQIKSKENNNRHLVEANPNIPTKRQKITKKINALPPSDPDLPAAAVLRIRVEAQLDLEAASSSGMAARVGVPFAGFGDDKQRRHAAGLGWEALSLEVLR